MGFRMPAYFGGFLGGAQIRSHFIGLQIRWDE